MKQRKYKIEMEKCRCEDDNNGHDDGEQMQNINIWTNEVVNVNGIVQVNTVCVAFYGR